MCAARRTGEEQTSPLPSRTRSLSRARLLLLLTPAPLQPSDDDEVAAGVGQKEGRRLRGLRRLERERTQRWGNLGNEDKHQTRAESGTRVRG